MGTVPKVLCAEFIGCDEQLFLTSQLLSLFDRDVLVQVFYERKEYLTGLFLVC